MQKWKTFTAMKRGKSSKWLQEQSYVCEGNLHNGKRYPRLLPSPTATLTYSTTFSLIVLVCRGHFPLALYAASRPLLHNYLIYYHQLQSFACFSFASLGFTFNDFFLCFYHTHDRLSFFVSFAQQRGDINFLFLGNPSSSLAFCSFVFPSIYMGKTFAFGITLWEEKISWKHKNEIIFFRDVCVWVKFLRARKKVRELWKSFITHSIYYQN